MGKQNDIDDLLGGDPAPKTKPKADKPAAKAKAETAPAKKAKADKPAAEAPAKKAKKAKEPIVFAEGEKEEIAKKVLKIVNKAEASSKDIAAKLGIATRKLRPVLYSMSRAGEVVLEAGESRVAGMMVFAAA